MRKYAFILLCFLFALVSCASDNVEPEPVKKSVPEISININGSAVVVACSYIGDDWLFIKGVEFRNASGETRRVTFKQPRRRVLSSGKVSEFATFSVAYGDEFLAWCGEEVEARALADWPQEFGAVDVIYMNIAE
jgi:hypothetical protein